MKSLTMWFSPPRHFLPPRPTYLPQHPLPNPSYNLTGPNKTTNHITVLHILNNSPSAYYNVTTFNSSQLHCMCVSTSDHFCRMPQFHFHCRAKPKRGVQGRLPTHLQVSYAYILNTSTTYTHRNIQGVPGGMCNTSGGCSLGQTIPI